MPSNLETTSPLALTKAAGDDASLELIYRRYSGWLAAKLTRSYGPRLADDLMQETYIRFAPYQKGREIRHPQALLWKIAQNLARNHHRRHAAREDLSVAWETLDDDHVARAPHQFEALVFKDMVLSLPPPLRHVVVLSRFSGMTNAEVALCTGTSVATVERRLAKAMRLCARHLLS